MLVKIHQDIREIITLLNVSSVSLLNSFSSKQLWRLCYCLGVATDRNKSSINDAVSHANVWNCRHYSNIHNIYQSYEFNS